MTETSAEGGAVTADSDVQEQTVIGRTPEDRGPITASRITVDLCELGLPSAAVVMVHSSLSALGWVAGGEQSVVEALLAAVGEHGTLVVPTHSTQLSDPAGWKNPPVPRSWWPVIRHQTAAFHRRLTPTRGMGRIPDCARSHPAAVRSNHPLFSFTAIGHHARDLCEEHPLPMGMGESSPLARIYELDGWVLLLGVSHDSNTSMHLAEHRACAAATIESGAPMATSQGTSWVTFPDLDYDSDDFAAIGAAFDQTGHVAIGRVGLAEARLMRQRRLVDFAVSAMRGHVDDIPPRPAHD